MGRGRGEEIERRREERGRLYLSDCWQRTREAGERAMLLGYLN
jgi:hypothetical protein